MKRLHMFPKFSSSKGQSLVEVALFFPIFIIMLAGLVEVANILVTQNRVTSAARASTRFAADGGEDAGMTTVLLNTVTQTLQLNQDVWDVWAVRGTVNEDGNAILDESWEFTHIYGISLTEDASEVDEDAVRAQVLDELQRDELGNQQAGIAGDLEFVGTYAIHDIDSILGLNAVPQLVGFKSVKELAVMRVLGYGQEATDGCDAFPIVVHEGIRSVTPVGTGSNPFPAAGDFDPGTQGQNGQQYSIPTYQQFINHVPDVPLLQAREGYVYRIWNGMGSGNFGWLRWNDGLNGDTGSLDGTLGWPGNSRNYTNYPNGDPNRPNGQAVPGSGFTWPVWGYIEPGDPTDHAMNVQDWVSANTGVSNASYLEETLVGHITARRTLRLLIWDTADGQGNNARYHINRFGIFRLQGYNLSGQGWILAEFIRWDDSCGQVTATP